MKKIVLFFLLISSSSIAQDSEAKFVLTLDGPEPVVLQFDGLTAQEISRRALKWFRTIYQDPNTSTVSVENGIIKVTGSLEKAFVLDIDLHPTPFDIEYSLQLSAEENKARVLIDIGHIWWHPFSRKADFTYRRFFNQDGQIRNSYLQPKKDLEKSINLFIQEFYQDMKIGANTLTRQTDDVSRVFSIVDKNAEPHHGFTSFYQFLTDNVHYPEQTRRSGVNGKMIFKFVVEPNGSLTNFEIIESLSKDCDKELIRVLRLCPNWIPGEVKGKKVRQEYRMPFIFKFQ